jgi:signal transduction histidine kinase
MLARSAGPLALNGLPRSTIHELRTPLTAIRGYAQLLMRGVKSPEQAQRAHETIFHESERLAGMLNQLSKVAEATLGTPEVDPIRFDLEKLVAVAVEQARARWPEHSFVHRAGPPAEVVADLRSLGEVLANLFDNAAAYSSPAATVESWLRAEERQACVAVRDRGVGIPTEELELIFERFWRASNVAQAGPRASRGLGVGLFLARAAATLAGGRIWAESELNQGSTFYLALPLAP